VVTGKSNRLLCTDVPVQAFRWFLLRGAIAPQHLDQHQAVTRAALQVLGAYLAIVFGNRGPRRLPPLPRLNGKEEGVLPASLVHRHLVLAYAKVPSRRV